jgi:hypothetical protein
MHRQPSTEETFSYPHFIFSCTCYEDMSVVTSQSYSDLLFTESGRNKLLLYGSAR